jgi:hypothetical protein
MPSASRRSWAAPRKGTRQKRARLRRYGMHRLSPPHGVIGAPPPPGVKKCTRHARQQGLLYHRHRDRPIHLLTTARIGEANVDIAHHAPSAASKKTSPCRQNPPISWAAARGLGNGAGPPRRPHRCRRLADPDDQRLLFAQYLSPLATRDCWSMVEGAVSQNAPQSTQHGEAGVKGGSGVVRERPLTPAAGVSPAQCRGPWWWRRSRNRHVRGSRLGRGLEESHGAISTVGRGVQTQCRQLAASSSRLRSGRNRWTRSGMG